MLLSLVFALLLASPEAEIRAVLDRQQADWNRGDIDAFVTGYENSPETTFSGKSFTRGYQKVLDNYKQRYPTREAMDSLEFSNIETRMIGATGALVTGRFTLKGRGLSGNFTLVFRKTTAGWKIIHDHTS
jgi:ketosteroid isomerase-like protein